MMCGLISVIRVPDGRYKCVICNKYLLAGWPSFVHPDLLDEVNKRTEDEARQNQLEWDRKHV